MINRIARSYFDLPSNILFLFWVELCLNLVHVGFILVLNIYLRSEGFSDPEIASFNSLRFIGALAFSLPLGIYIKSKRLKPFFILSAILVPIISIVLIESIRLNIIPLIQLSFLSWGIAMMFLRVCSLPFIIRNTTSQNSSQALSLNAATWSLATIISGVIISGLNSIQLIHFFNIDIIFNERTILWLITLISISSIPLSLKIEEQNNVESIESNKNALSINKSYDWDLIFKAISPLILISIGAGLTIPFVNLFFNSVFNFSSSDFSLLGSVTAILVFFIAYGAYIETKVWILDDDCVCSRTIHRLFNYNGYD